MFGIDSISCLNPFRGMIETEINHSPNARTLRTNFKQKCIDAFFIFCGGMRRKSDRSFALSKLDVEEIKYLQNLKVEQENKVFEEIQQKILKNKDYKLILFYLSESEIQSLKNSLESLHDDKVKKISAKLLWDTPELAHVGFLDWIFFPFLPLLYWTHDTFWKWVMETKPPEENKFVYYVLKGGGLFVLNFLVNGWKYVVAAVLTLVSLPVIGLVNGIAYLLRKDLTNSLYAFNVEDASIPESRRAEPPTTLTSLLKLMGNNNYLGDLKLLPLPTQHQFTEDRPLPKGVDVIPRHANAPLQVEHIEFTFGHASPVEADGEERHPRYIFKFNVDQTTGKVDNPHAYNAIFKLNLGQITTQLENLQDDTIVNPIQYCNF